MKVSDITAAQLADYLRLDDYTDTELLTVLLAAARSFVRSYTGLDDEQIDKLPDIVPVVYILVQDMYDNRALQVDKSNINRVVETILGMHSHNLL